MPLNTEDTKATNSTEAKPKVIAKKTSTKKASDGAKIAILWDPKRDKSVMRGPVGAPNKRPFTFAWFDPAEVEARRAEREKAEAMFREPILRAYNKTEVIDLKPGLNWIDADTWSQALAASESRDSNQIKARIDDGSIEVMEPTGSTGTIKDYSVEDAKRIIDTLKTYEELGKLLKDAEDPMVKEYLIERIEDVKGRFN